MWLHFPHLKYKILSNLIIYIYIVQVPSFFLGIHWSFHPCLLLLHLSSLVKWNCRCYNFQVQCRSKLQLVSFILWHGVFLLILLSYTTCRMLTDVDGLPNEVNGIQSGKSAYRNTFQNFDSVALFTKIKTYEFAQDFICPKDFVPWTRHTKDTKNIMWGTTAKWLLVFYLGL